MRPRGPAWRGGALALALGLALAGCAAGPAPRVLQVDGPPEGGGGAQPYGLPLRSGQVAVSLAGGPLSIFFSLYPETFAPYVHAGVVAVEDGRPYVYEMMGRMKPVFNRPPPEATTGRVRRTPLARFVQAQRYVEVYDPPPGVDRARVAAFARAQYLRRTPFDAYFVSDDRSRLYCTELVAAALEAGGGGPYPVTPNRDNPSLRVVRGWLGIAAEGSIQAATLVAGSRRVATLSATGSLTDARVRAEVAREIHRRFTADQKLGNVFAWTGTGLRFREPILAFRHRARHLFDGVARTPEPSEAAAAVRDLAREMFGPIPVPGARRLAGR